MSFQFLRHHISERILFLKILLQNWVISSLLELVKKIVLLLIKTHVSELFLDF